MIHFFKKEEEKEIIAAVKEAELNTSGEIRIHLEKDFEGDITDAALKTFYKLKMERTAQNNAVLIFIVPKRKQFAIIGDKGINDVVPPGFWDDTRNLMQGYFREKQFATGIVEGVKLVGQNLKAHFPWQSDDVNELPDDISFGTGN